MSKRRDEHVPSEPGPGRVSEGGVDTTTGATAGALIGGLLGAAGGPAGLGVGAALGGLLGGIAAAGPEHPYYPEPWLTRREQLHQRARHENNAN